MRSGGMEIVMDYLHTTLGIPEDKEDYVIELYSDSCFFGEIERQDKNILLKIYNHPSNCWFIDLNQLHGILEKAKSELE